MVLAKGVSMTDFTTNIDMNVRMMNEKLSVDRNFDILQRDVLIGGKRTHFYFIDGFVQEETIEKLVQFFYSLKESDIKDIDTNSYEYLKTRGVQAKYGISVKNKEGYPIVFICIEYLDKKDVDKEQVEKCLIDKQIKISTLLDLKY